MATDAARRSTAKAWHPCDDGLIPIADALATVANCCNSKLVDRLKQMSSRPSRGLSMVTNYCQTWSEDTPDGTRRHRTSRERLEQLCDWLELSDRNVLAAEIRSRVRNVHSGLAAWEHTAAALVLEAETCVDDLPPEGYRALVHYVGEELCEELGELCRECEVLEDKLRDTATVVRANLRGIVADQDGPIVPKQLSPRDAAIMKMHSDGLAPKEIQHQLKKDYSKLSNDVVRQVISRNK